MMNCAEVSDLLSEYIDGDLSQDKSREIQIHIASCSACSAELASFESLLSRAAALPRSIEPVRDLWNGIAVQISPAGDRNESMRTEVSARRDGKFLPDRERTKPDITRAGASSPWRSVQLKHVFAIAATLIVIVGAYWYASLGPAAAWIFSGLEGSPRSGTSLIVEDASVQEGILIETDADSRAKIHNAMVGNVDVEPNTRLKLIANGPAEHRFVLERGTISASTWVPPHVFVVETPSAVAVDLGCEYRLMVDESGGSLLLVTAGWVALDWKGREVIVPATSLCHTRSGSAPGTPFSEYASDTLKRALEQFDFENGGINALSVVLAQSREHDAVTLWHLLSRVSDSERPLVYDRLALLVPPRRDIMRERVLLLDKNTLERLWDSFEPVPISELRSKPSSWKVLWYDLVKLLKAKAS